MSEVLDLDVQVFGAIGDDRAGDGVDRGLVVEVKDNVGPLVVVVIHEVTNERKKDRKKKKPKSFLTYKSCHSLTHTQ